MKTKSIYQICLLSISLLLCFGIKAQETQIQYLSGKDKDHTVNWQFYCTAGAKSGQWSTIPVPSCWELQGFGKYDYGFVKDSIKGKEEGWYKYPFKVSNSWKDKIINLVFEGVMTDAEVRVNGVVAGAIHQGAFYAFKYEVSHLLKFDQENILEVKVAKHSANQSVNEAERKGDFWVFGGIFRPVFLEALPKQHIAEMAIDANANGDLTARVKTRGDADEISLELCDISGKEIGKGFKMKTTDSISTIAIFYTNLKLWSAEFPNLYQAKIKLFDHGKLVHVQSQKIGFRTVVVKPRDGIYINGVKMKFKGVNRHSFWPNSGRTTSKDLSIKEVQLMKDMNMNAVRMSHYPPDKHFLEVCDSLGLYVMDELAGWHGNYDTPTGTKLLKEMMQHDQNHTSIVIWSNGNEGGHNLELDQIFEKWDMQQRPLVHPWQLYKGIETQHYREYHYGVGNYENGHDILLPTEFLHGWFDGGHGAGLEDYWESMWNNPLAAGGFLWAFADEAVVRTDKNGLLDTDNFRGADGIVGPYHEKEGSYFAIKEIWSPIHIERREIAPGFNGKFLVENRYSFTNLNQCGFSWRLAKFGSLETVKGKINAPSIEPLEKGMLFVALPTNWRTFDCLYLTATGPDGKEIFTWSYPIRLPKDLAKQMVEKEGMPIVQMEQKDSLYLIVVGDLSLKINSKNGLLQEVKNGSTVIPFNQGPVLQEGVNNFAGFNYHFEGKNLVIASQYDKKKSYNTLEWTIYPSGWVKMKTRYFPSAYFTDFVGVNFSFPESQIKGVEYLGKGPYRVWKNRLKGGSLGIWNKTYNNTETGESWVYPEFKGYHANLYWAKLLTKEKPITIVTETEDLFLRLFTPAFKTDQWKNYETLFPSGDISLMQGIPSIGSKSQRNDTTGPMGLKNIFYDYEKDPTRALELVVYFNFLGQ
ncbi:MAG: hypothetical protein RLY89_1790 [Bacteroidota bacterium]